MRLSDWHSLVSTPATITSPETIDAAWRRTFALSRIAALGLVFAVLPLALALYPKALLAGLPAVLAVLASAALGLIGIRFRAPADALALTVLGYVPLALAPWLGGLTAATAGLAMLALGLEWLTAPAEVRRQGWLAGLGGLAMLVIGLAAYASGAATPGAAGTLAGLALIAMPLAALIATVAAARQLAEVAGAAATRTLHRDSMVVAAADLAAIVLDRSGSVAEVTPAAARLLAGSEGDLAARGLIDRVLIADRPAFLKAVADAAGDGRHSRLTLRLATRSEAGRAPEFEDFDVMLRPAPGAAAILCLQPASVGVAARLRPSARADLFATLSHEIRTPMNAILGFSEILASPDLPPREAADVQSYAGLIHSAAGDAFAVTQALVDLLRVESADYAVGIEQVDIRAMAGSILKATAERAAGRADTRLVAPTLLDPIVTDPRLVRMLLSNLIEGFVQAGAAAPLSVDLAARAGGIAMGITGRRTEASARAGHAAYLGVVAALARRIAERLGCEIELVTEGPELSARLVVPAAGTVAPLPVRAPTPVSAFVPPVRKSA
jgi:cell cycle sensor histidine kinase DivJ